MKEETRKAILENSFSIAAPYGTSYINNTKEFIEVRASAGPMWLRKILELFGVELVKL